MVTKFSMGFSTTLINLGEILLWKYECSHIKIFVLPEEVKENHAFQLVSVVYTTLSAIDDLRLDHMLYVSLWGI